MITIGEFSLSTGVSVKALRFYDERGLLTPAEVDPHSGYRRYRAAQMRTATTIRILRTAGMSVEDVKTALEEPDRLPDLLQGHAAELERRRDLEDRAMKHAAEAAEGQLEQLAAALAEAGVTITGTFWAGLEAAGASPAVIDQRLALPVEGEVPSSFSVPGLRIETGVLPRREEAYVEFTMADDWPDLLEGAPGGPLPPDQLITLTEMLEERGIERAEIRQRATEPHAEGHPEDADQDALYSMEAAVTVAVLD